MAKLHDLKCKLIPKLLPEEAEAERRHGQEPGSTASAFLCNKEMSTFLRVLNESGQVILAQINQWFSNYTQGISLGMQSNFLPLQQTFDDSPGLSTDSETPLACTASLYEATETKKKRSLLAYMLP